MRIAVTPDLNQAERIQCSDEVPNDAERKSQDEADNWDKDEDTDENNDNNRDVNLKLGI